MPLGAVRGRSPQAQRRPATSQPRAVDYRGSSRLSSPSSITSFPWRTLSQLAGVEATTKHHSKVRRVREEARARDEEADLDTNDTFAVPPKSSSTGTWGAKKGNASLMMTRESVRNASKLQSQAIAVAAPPPLPQPGRPHSRLASMRGRNDRDVAEREAAVELRKLRSAHKRAIIERAAQERSVPLTTTRAKSSAANGTTAKGNTSSAARSHSSSQARRKQGDADRETDRDVRMMRFVLQGLHTNANVNGDNDYKQKTSRLREGACRDDHPPSPRDESVAAVGLYLMNTTMKGSDEDDDEAEYAGIRVDDGGYSSSSSDGAAATSAPSSLSSDDENEDKEKEEKGVAEEEARRPSSPQRALTRDGGQKAKRSSDDEDDEGPPLVRDEELHQLYRKLNFHRQVYPKLEANAANPNNNRSSNGDGYAQHDEKKRSSFVEAAPTDENDQFSLLLETEDADAHDEPREAATLLFEYGNDNNDDELDVYRSMLEKFVVHRSRDQGEDDEEHNVEEEEERKIKRLKKESKKRTSSAKLQSQKQKRSTKMPLNNSAATVKNVSVAPLMGNTVISNALFDTNASSVSVALSSFRLHWRTAINSIECKKRAKIISEESKAFSSIIYYLYLGHDAITARERSFYKWFEAVLIAENAHRVKVVEEQKAHRKALKAYELSTRRRLISYLEKRMARKGDQSDAAVGRRREVAFDRIEIAITGALAAGEGNVDDSLLSNEGETRGVRVAADRKSVVSIVGSSKKQNDAQRTADSPSMHRDSVVTLDEEHSSPQKLVVGRRSRSSAATAATPLLSPSRRSTNSGTFSPSALTLLEQQPLNRGVEEADDENKIAFEDLQDTCKGADEVASRRKRQSSASGGNTVRQQQQQRPRPSSAAGTVMSNSEHLANLKIHNSTIFEIKRASVGGAEGDEKKKDPRGRSPSNLLLISNNVGGGGGGEENSILGLSSLRSRSVVAGSSVVMEGGGGASSISKIGGGQRPSSSSAMQLPHSTTSREQCQRDVRWAYEAKRLTDKLRHELLSLPQGQEKKKEEIRGGVTTMYGEEGTREVPLNRDQSAQKWRSERNTIDKNKKRETARGDSVRRGGEAGRDRATASKTTPNNFSFIRARAEKVYAERVKAIKENTGNQHNESGLINNQRRSSSRTRSDGLPKTKVNAAVIESCVPPHTNFFMISLTQQKGTEGDVEGCSPSALVSSERLQQAEQRVSFMERCGVHLSPERSGLSSPSNAFLHASRGESTASSTRLSLTPLRATHLLPAVSKQAPPPHRGQAQGQRSSSLSSSSSSLSSSSPSQRIHVGTAGYSSPNTQRHTDEEEQEEQQLGHGHEVHQHAAHLHLNIHDRRRLRILSRDR